MRQNKFWIRPDDRGPAQTTQPPGHKPLVVNIVVVRQFEEEEGSITSDVVQVLGKDPDTPG